MARGTPQLVTRRALLLTAALAGCGRKLAPRYQGWLFVSSEAEKGIAVADLAEFKRVQTIPLGQTPGQIVVSKAGVFVVCAESLVRIDLVKLKVADRVGLPGRAVSAALMGESPVLAVVLDRPGALVLVDLASNKIASKVALPGQPAGLTASSNMLAVAAGNQVLRFQPAAMGGTEIGSRPGPLAFRNDGKTILVGLPETKELVTLDSATGGLLSRLTLAVAPRRFLFNPDGGQMFITGGGMDAVVIANPYQNEIDQTVSAGHEPGAMAVQAQQNVLLVSNPSTGNVTLLDIDTRRLAGTVTVNGQPGEILVTPGGEYALVVSADSGDVSVIRMVTVLDRKMKTKPVFTVFPTGPKPRSAAIVPTAG
jgi:DNA-binding beta-propeller fold protein YncE